MPRRLWHRAALRTVDVPLDGSTGCTGRAARAGGAGHRQVAGDLGGHGRWAKGDGNGIFVEIHSFFMIVHEYSSMNHDVLMICFFVWQPDL